jgi:hypothetical protein
MARKAPLLWRSTLNIWMKRRRAVPSHPALAAVIRLSIDECVRTSENLLDLCEAWLYLAALMRPSDPSAVRLRAPQLKGFQVETDWRPDLLNRRSNAIPGFQLSIAFAALPSLSNAPLYCDDTPSIHRGGRAHSPQQLQRWGCDVDTRGVHSTQDSQLWVRRREVVRRAGGADSQLQEPGDAEVGENLTSRVLNSTPICKYTTLKRAHPAMQSFS